MSIGSELFEAIDRHNAAEEDAEAAILKELGFDYEKPGTWPCKDFSFDPYDCSFELLKCDPAWEPTRRQLQRCFNLGFSRAWIVYSNGMELHATPGKVWADKSSLHLAYTPTSPQPDA